MFLTPVAKALEEINKTLQGIAVTLAAILKVLQKQPQVPGEAVSLKLTLGKAVQQK